MHWTDRQITGFAKDLRDDLDNAWLYMVPEVRAAFVDAKVLTLIRASARESIPMTLIDELATKLRTELDLLGV